MTAYELAKELDWHWDNDCKSPAISKAADMLRQQAEELDLVEQFLKERREFGQFIVWLSARERI